MVGEATELQIVDSYSSVFQHFEPTFLASTFIILVYCGVILEVAPPAPSESAAHVRSPSNRSLFMPTNRLHSAGVSVNYLKKILLSIAGFSSILLDVCCHLVIYLFFNYVLFWRRSIVGGDVCIIFVFEVSPSDV